MRIENTAFWKILLNIQKCLIIVLGVVVAGIVAVACLGRPVGFNFGGFEELLVIVVFWLYMLGCSYGSSEESQITADILKVMMKEGLLKDIISLIKYTLTMVLGAIMFVWAVQLALWSISNGMMTTVYRLPTVTGQASMSIGLAFTTFYNICYWVREIQRFVTGRKRASEKRSEVIA